MRELEEQAGPSRSSSGQHPVDTDHSSVIEGRGFGQSRRTWESEEGISPALPLTGCMPSGKSSDFLKPSAK